MKHTVLTGALCLLLGIAIGWIAKPATGDAPERSDAPAVAGTNSRATLPGGTSPDTKSSRPDPVRTRTTVINGQEVDQAEIEEMTRNTQDRMQKMLLDRQRKKADRRFAELVDALGLDATQQASLKAFFDKQLEDLGAMNMMTGGDMSSPKDYAALLRNEGIDDALAALLTDEQGEAYEQLKTRERERKIESEAFKDLGKLNGVLDLTAAQKEAVYDVLYEDAARKLDESPDATAMMSVMTEGMGIEMDFDDFGLGSAIQAQMDESSENPNADPNAWRQTMKDQAAQKIDEQVERLGSVLTAEQTTRYREHLEAKADALFNGMMFGMHNSVEIEGEGSDAPAPEATEAR